MRIEKYAEEVNKMAGTGLNIFPMLSLFMLLISFMLLTTSFGGIAVYNLNLPKQVKSDGLSGGGSGNEIDKPSDRLFVSIDGTGVRVGVNSKISNYLSNGELQSYLEKLKKEYRTRNDIVIISEAKVKYQQIITIIDICSRNDFTEVSVASAAN
jgi:biopolymer transport protein ExbD